MHTLLFLHDGIHIENLGGAIDEVLDRRIRFGCFPWRFQGDEAAFCRLSPSWTEMRANENRGDRRRRGNRAAASPQGRTDIS
jgi:hypothetical protein